jgi:BirA family biotin operon repressor/biotin-[acetyl-CoA-carboxylase] ligase
MAARVREGRRRVKARAEVAPSSPLCYVRSVKRILLSSVPSTNDYALELLRTEKPEEGTVVQAVHQTRGRGQMGASWEAEPGRGLTVSMILYPDFLDPADQFPLCQAMALGVADCVAELCRAEPRLKWPNDVLLEGRKVAGILVESRIAAGRLAASVVGIGLNVNQSSFPAGVEGATSLACVTGSEQDLERVLEGLHASLLSRYHELRGDAAATRRAYLARLDGLNEERRFLASGRAFRGAIRGVDEEGRLLVEEVGGTQHAFRLREVAQAPRGP